MTPEEARVYDAEEGYDRLMGAWKYLLDTYKTKGELPKKHWDTEEIIKAKMWVLFGIARGLEEYEARCAEDRRKERPAVQ